MRRGSIGSRRRPPRRCRSGTRPRPRRGTACGLPRRRSCSAPRETPGRRAPSGSGRGPPKSRQLLRRGGGRIERGASCREPPLLFGLRATGIAFACAWGSVTGPGCRREHALERNRCSCGRLAGRFHGVGLDQQEAGLVLRDEDRPHEPDRPSLRRQRRGGATRTPRLAPDGVAIVTGHVQLDKELGHAFDGRAPVAEPKPRKPRVFRVYDPRSSGSATPGPRRAASCPRERMPSFAYVRDRWYSTVLTVTTRAWAISLFARPLAASSATRRSAALSSPSRDGRRAPTRSTSPRVSAAQPGEPSASKASTAASSVVRAAPHFRWRRCARPSASCDLAASNGSPRLTYSWAASWSSFTARSS